MAVHSGADTGSKARKRGRRQFPHRRCGKNGAELRVNDIELSRSFQHIGTRTADLARPKIGSKAFQQSLTVFRSVLPLLLEFDDVGTNKPIAQDQCLVDSNSSMPEQLLAGRINGFDELRVFHISSPRRRGCSKFCASFAGV